MPSRSAMRSEKTTRIADLLGMGLLYTLSNRFRQRLRYLRKLILLTIAFIIVLGILHQPLLVLHRIVMVVYPHDAIDRIGQRPIERCAQSFSFRLESVDRRSYLEIASPAALDGDDQLPVFEWRTASIVLDRVAHLEVILD